MSCRDVFTYLFALDLPEMIYSCYQESFVILGRLVYWVVVEKCAAGQKKKIKIGNYRLVSLLRLAGVCQKSSLLDGFPSCISTGKLE